MSRFTRRQILRILSSILPASALGLWSEGRRDAFDRERVCVHVFQPGLIIPKPLWDRYDAPPVSRSRSDLFNLAVPELILCRTEKKFLSIFQYFWPIERSEFLDAFGKVSVLFEKRKITGMNDVLEFSSYLDNINAKTKYKFNHTAILFTFNDVTRNVVADHLKLWQAFGIGEFVLFKDPSRAPYLCSYPSLQKGFKRPPPI